MLFFVRFSHITGYWEIASDKQRNIWKTIEINGEKLRKNNQKIIKELISNETGIPKEDIQILVVQPENKEEWFKTY